MTRQSRDEPDYYRILGVLSDASAEEITAAFYALARRHHPDTARHEDPSNQEFKAIVEAYEVLTDPRRRREYDRLRRSPIRVTVHPTSGQPGPARTGSTRPTSAATSSAADLYAELPVTPEEARLGGPCELRVTRLVRCHPCAGTGTVGREPCHVCQSIGRETRRQTLVIQLPPGVRTGSTLCLPNLGHELAAPEGRSAARRGCLYLGVVIRPCW